MSKRIAKLLQDTLGKILRQLLPLGSTNMLITITDVILHRDLRTAKVFISFLPTTTQPKSIPKDLLALLRESDHIIQRQLAQRLSKRIRRIPQVAFEHDQTPEHVLTIEQLLKRKTH